MREPSRLLSVLFLACIGCAAMSRGAAVSAPYLGAVVSDAATGRIIFEDNADVITPPASMTKLMTFAVLHDVLARGGLTLQTHVTVTAADARIGGTQVYLKEKEVFPVEELIYAMMIQSANDAAHALARAAGGSTEAFVEMMNAKARALGMTRTTFRSPHGLPPADRKKSDGDLSTPRDYAVLCRYLVLETDVLKYTSVRARPFGTSRPQGAMAMNNHNHLLGKVTGMDGLKTGFTNGAGFCLSATAERNGRRVIVVAMGSPTTKVRDSKVSELIERGFAGMPAELTVKTTHALPAPLPDSIPTVSTDKNTPATDEDTSSPPPAVTFKVIPPH